MALTDETGTKVEEYFYDACLSAEMYMKAEGNKKNPANWSEDDTLSKPIIDRGYTGHEHWEHFSLINMNGRVYDPQLGRFLSPDPVMQASNFTQNYNKYSYVYNNPLVFSDPTGEFAWGLVFIAAWYGGMQGLGHVAQTNSNPTWKDFAQGWLIGSSIGGATAAAGIGGSYIASVAGSALYGGAVGASAGALNALAFDGNVGSSALYGGIIGGFTGLISGLQKYELRNAENYEYIIGKVSDEELRINMNSYNESIGDIDSEILRINVKDEFNKEIGDMGITDITTKGDPRKYGLTGDGLYVKLKTGDLVGGYYDPDNFNPYKGSGTKTNEN